MGPPQSQPPPLPRQLFSTAAVLWSSRRDHVRQDVLDTACARAVREFAAGTVPPTHPPPPVPLVHALQVCIAGEYTCDLFRSVALTAAPAAVSLRGVSLRGAVLVHENNSSISNLKENALQGGGGFEPTYCTRCMMCRRAGLRRGGP